MKYVKSHNENCWQKVDFIAIDGKGHPALAVQVCMDISHEETLQRELDAIVATAKYFKIKENLILTYNQEKDFQTEGITVRAKPVWRWLLESQCKRLKPPSA